MYTLTQDAPLASEARFAQRRSRDTSEVDTAAKGFGHVLEVDFAVSVVAFNYKIELGAKDHFDQPALNIWKGDQKHMYEGSIIIGSGQTASTATDSGPTFRAGDWVNSVSLLTASD